MNPMISKELSKRLLEIEKTLLSCLPEVPPTGKKFNRDALREYMEIKHAYCCTREARQAMQGKLPNDK